MEGKTQQMVAAAGSIGATAVVRKGLEATWKVGSKGKNPPTDPTDPQIRVREAILFAVLSGAAIGVVRILLARKLAAKERHENARQQGITTR